MQTERNSGIGEEPIAIVIANARAMPPAPLAGAISRHQSSRVRDRQLLAGEARDRCRNVRKVFEEGAEQPKRPQLDRNAEAVVVAAMPANECAIGVI